MEGRVDVNLPKKAVNSVKIGTCKEVIQMGGKDSVLGGMHPTETQCSIKARMAVQ